MKLRFVIFSSVFLLVSGKSFCSEPSYNPVLSSFGSHIEQDQDDSAAIDDADLIDLIDEDFTCIGGEYSMRSSHTSRSGSRNGGQDLSDHHNLQQRISFPVTGLSRIPYPVLRYHSAEGKTAPLFLLYQAFRI